VDRIRGLDPVSPRSSRQWSARGTGPRPWGRLIDRRARASYVAEHGGGGLSAQLSSSAGRPTDELSNCCSGWRVRQRLYRGPIGRSADRSDDCVRRCRTLIRPIRCFRDHPDNHERTGRPERLLQGSRSPSVRRCDFVRFDVSRNLAVTSLLAAGFGHPEMHCIPTKESREE
jgi:hypothetical protein